MPRYLRRTPLKGILPSDFLAQYANQQGFAGQVQTPQGQRVWVANQFPQRQPGQGNDAAWQKLDEVRMHLQNKGEQGDWAFWRPILARDVNTPSGKIAAALPQAQGGAVDLAAFKKACKEAGCLTSHGCPAYGPGVPAYCRVLGCGYRLDRLGRANSCRRATSRRKRRRRRTVRRRTRRCKYGTRGGKPGAKCLKAPRTRRLRR